MNYKEKKKHQRDSNLKVANKANPRKKGLTKAEKQLKARILDYERTVSGLKNHIAGSFHRPGSLSGRK